jgi:SAM-dependent methyltransferase
MKRSQNRNSCFYSKYNSLKYYSDYLNCGASVFQYFRSQSELREIESVIKRSQPKSILVVGIGFGREIDALLKLSANSEIVGIDFNQLFIDELKERYNNARVQFHRFDLMVDSVAKLESKFDLIICLNTLEYLKAEAAKKFLFEINGILNSGGRFFLRYLSRDYIFYFNEKRHMDRRSEDSPYLYFMREREVFDSIQPQLKVDKFYMGDILPTCILSDLIRSNELCGIGLWFYNKVRHFKNIRLARDYYVIFKKD